MNRTSNLPYMFGGLSLFISIVIFIAAFTTGYPPIRTKMHSDAYVKAAKVELNSHLSQSDGGTMYSPIFFYNVDNKEYSCSSSVSSSWKPDINNSKVYYNSNNPNHCVSEYEFTSILFFVCVLSIIALSMFVVGAFVLFIIIKRNVKNKKLLKHGQLIKNIPCTITPSNVTLNDKMGYIIEVEYQGLKLKSETKFDIDIRRNSVDLLIDPLNSKNYFIDFDINNITE